jgi:Zn-dependent protease with chaperone function
MRNKIVPRKFALVLLLLLTGCGIAFNAPHSGPLPLPDGTPVPSPEQAARSFARVVQAVEPVAERECRRKARMNNCDFLIRVDPDTHAEPNAYQSVDESGRPVLTFTIALIASVANPDEMAFVMSHEAAHHIAGHLVRQAENAAAGARVFADLATLTGGNARDVARAEKLGAVVGAQTYSREFELEADELGTIIAYRAGYDPLRGAEFFNRLPDPGDQFLGSHPPNAARIQAVRRISQKLGLTPG